jgi:DNA-binding NarL/FixJ family response regulator
MTIRVLVVDDHEMVAESFRRALSAADGMEVVDVVDTVARAIAAAAEHRPDITLMDYQLPDGTGAEATAGILANQPDAKVMLLTGSGDRHALHDALRAGCIGYLEKTSPLERLIEAVRAVAVGEAVISPEELGRALSEERSPAARHQLTPREQDILRLIVEGLSNRAIAERLTLSVHTVRTHVQTVLSKLGVHSKLEAAALARREQLT